MKISIESHILNHHTRSGLMTYTEGLVYGISTLDHTNEYSLLYYSFSKNSQEMPGPQKENFHKIVLKIPDREFMGRQQLLDNFILPKFLKENKINVFHRTSGYTMPKIKGVFSILTVHDLRTLTIGDNLWKQNITNYKKTISDLNLCVVVSECTKKDLIEHLGVPESKIKVIYLGADKRFRPSSTNFINQIKHKYNLNKPFLLSVGSVPRKNIDNIIKGFAASKITKEFQLVLACHNDVAKYHALAQSLKIDDKVTILPNLTDEEIVAMYSCCQSFVFPSLYEGFGLPILEAMQCGAPVITSNVSSCPEVAGDSAILVNPVKIPEIAEAMNEICSNTNLRNDLIQKGFKRSQLFGWDNYAKEIKKIYSLA